MTDAELADHAWWGWFWTTIEHTAFFGLIIALAIEFLSLKLAEPHKKAVEDDKDFKIAELNNETARLRAKEQLVDDALLANTQAARDIAFATQQNGVTAERLALAQGLITPAQMSEAARSLSIVPKVSPFAGKKFDAVTISNRIELGVFLRSLRAALTTAGWIEVNRDIGERQREQSNVGGTVLVTIHADSTRDPQLLAAAETLASALNAEGIAATVSPKTETDTNANVIHILVGPKP
jgi:hypothetical protein